MYFIIITLYIIFLGMYLFLWIRTRDIRNTVYIDSASLFAKLSRMSVYAGILVHTNVTLYTLVSPRELLEVKVHEETRGQLEHQ